LTTCTGNISRFVTLFSNDDIKLNFFSVSNGSNQFFRVVFNDGRLMDKDVLLGIGSVDETISALDVEPFHNSRHFRRYDFFGDVVGSLILGVLGSRVMLLVRVSHGVNWRLMDSSLI